MAAKNVADLTHLALPGALFAIKVSPSARQSNLSIASDGTLRVMVTAAPENGRATDAARILLAQALGVAKTRLVLVRGATSRDKLFRLNG